MSKRILAVIATCMLTMLANSAIAQNPPERKGKGGSVNGEAELALLSQNKHIFPVGISPGNVRPIPSSKGAQCVEFPQYRQHDCEYWAGNDGASWVTVNAHMLEQGQGRVIAVLKRHAGASQYQLVGSWHYKMHQIAGTRPGASRKFDIEWIADSGTPNMPAEAPAAIAQNEQAPANDCKKGDIVCLLINKKIREATRQAGEEGAMGTTNPIKKK